MTQLIILIGCGRFLKFNKFQFVNTKNVLNVCHISFLSFVFFLSSFEEMCVLVAFSGTAECAIITFPCKILSFLRAKDTIRLSLDHYIFLSNCFDAMCFYSHLSRMEAKNAIWIIHRRGCCCCRCCCNLTLSLLNIDFILCAHRLFLFLRFDANFYYEPK